MSSGNTVKDLTTAFETGDLGRVKEILESLLKNLPYDVHQKPSEGLYHGLLHIVFQFLGIYVKSEVHAYLGRVDSVVETRSHVYLFEFKFNETAEAGLEQIKRQDYAGGHRAKGKKVVGIGVNFSVAGRGIDGWVEERI